MSNDMFPEPYNLWIRDSSHPEGRVVKAGVVYEGWNKNSLYSGKQLIHKGRKP